MSTTDASISQAEAGLEKASGLADGNSSARTALTSVDLDARLQEVQLGDKLPSSPSTAALSTPSYDDSTLIPSEARERSRAETTVVSIDGKKAGTGNASIQPDNARCHGNDCQQEKGEKNEPKEDGHGGASRKSSKKERLEDSPDLAHFNDAQKKVILDQTRMFNEERSVKYIDIYWFSTKSELALNLLGLIAAIASGVVQPLMTVLFGALTT